MSTNLCSIRRTAHAMLLLPLPPPLRPGVLRVRCLVPVQLHTESSYARMSPLPCMSLMLESWRGLSSSSIINTSAHPCSLLSYSSVLGWTHWMVSPRLGPQLTATTYHRDAPGPPAPRTPLAAQACNLGKSRPSRPHSTMVAHLAAPWHTHGTTHRASPHPCAGVALGRERRRRSAASPARRIGQAIVNRQSLIGNQ
jgi:hypothetical protein